jgi:hypothetical protein
MGHCDSKVSPSCNVIIQQTTFSTIQKGQRCIGMGCIGMASGKLHSRAFCN